MPKGKGIWPTTRSTIIQVLLLACYGTIPAGQELHGWMRSRQRRWSSSYCGVVLDSMERDFYVKQAATGQSRSVRGMQKHTYFSTVQTDVHLAWHKADYLSLVNTWLENASGCLIPHWYKYQYHTNTAVGLIFHGECLSSLPLLLIVEQLYQ